GSADNGEITIYAGPLIIATVRMAFLFESAFDESTHRLPRRNIGGDDNVEVSSSLYKQIFAAYSHADTPVVLACRNVYKALGYNVLIDIDTLRSGHYWNQELMRMIERSDIFQLFWSARS